ncbi:DUF1801 domain-containing protein [Roseobacter sp. HKCCA0434]|uniref:DUF1801 domain-containing protein n=1 Tax=Roseobacter sp. HKCCA0434 TaxID=3079297 RepID=UPI002905C2B6|nr:DUF1801 domain-containing protein [Roseobacter sp. HKCCA0434]
MPHETKDAFHAALAPEDRAICDRLRAAIDDGLPEAESKVRHAHPVWFLNHNPIVGYSRLKDCVRLMFWSGQGFATPGLTPTGTFKAAELRIRDVADLDAAPLTDWLAEARKVQWDYANIVKRKGRLERLR